MTQQEENKKLGDGALRNQQQINGTEEDHVKYND
jgi:hypothetical protein